MAPTVAATQIQIEALLNFMEAHQDLARGLLRGPDGRMRAKQLWESLCTSLNSMGGCTKTVDQWQRVWADKKHLTKKAAGAARKLASATGGGPSTAPNLSPVELRILSIMGEGFGEPQTTARVPAFPSFPPIQHTTATIVENVDVPTPIVLSSEEQPEVLEVTFENPPTQNQQTINSRRRARPRPRVRRHLPADSRNEIIEIERERNEEIRQIKTALLELCSLLRQNLTRQ